MNEGRCSITRVANGYTVEMRDPKIVAENEKRDAKGAMVGRWKDPNVSFVFQTSKQVMEFLDSKLAAMLPAPDYDSAFAKAAKETTA